MPIPARLTAFGFRAVNWRQTVWFYTRVLLMDLEGFFESDTRIELFFAHQHSPHVRLRFWYDVGEGEPTGREHVPRTAGVQLVFYVSRLGQTLDRCRRMGFRVNIDKREFYRLKTALVTDPNGFSVLFVEATESQLWEPEELINPHRDRSMPPSVRFAYLSLNCGNVHYVRLLLEGMFSRQIQKVHGVDLERRETPTETSAVGALGLAAFVGTTLKAHAASRRQAGGESAPDDQPSVSSDDDAGDAPSPGRISALALYETVGLHRVDTEEFPANRTEYTWLGNGPRSQYPSLCLVQRLDNLGTEDLVSRIAVGLQVSDIDDGLAELAHNEVPLESHLDQAFGTVAGFRCANFLVELRDTHIWQSPTVPCIERPFLPTDSDADAIEQSMQSVPELQVPADVEDGGGQPSFASLPSVDPSDFGALLQRLTPASSGGDAPTGNDSPLQVSQKVADAKAAVYQQRYDSAYAQNYVRAHAKPAPLDVSHADIAENLSQDRAMSELTASGVVTMDPSDLLASSSLATELVARPENEFSPGELLLLATQTGAAARAARAVPEGEKLAEGEEAQKIIERHPTLVSMPSATWAKSFASLSSMVMSPRPQSSGSSASAKQKRGSGASRLSPGRSGRSEARRS